jgi:hypothetical protein
MAAPDFTVAYRQEDSPVASTDSRHHMLRLVHIRVHSAALIMEESREASPLAGSRALAEVSTEAAAFTEAEAVTVVAVTGNSIH